MKYRANLRARPKSGELKAVRGEVRVGRFFGNKSPINGLIKGPVAMSQVRFFDDHPPVDARWETLEQPSWEDDHQDEAGNKDHPPAHTLPDLPESPLSPESPERRGAPGHYTHTAHRRHHEHKVDLHYESTLPALSPSGIMRSPGGRELTRGDNGALSSPGGTVRPGVVALTGGTVRLGVLTDNYVDGGWAPLTREQLRKGGFAQGRERVAHFADDVANSASSAGNSEKQRRHHHFILGRRYGRVYMYMYTYVCIICVGICSWSHEKQKPMCVYGHHRGMYVYIGFCLLWLREQIPTHICPYISDTSVHIYVNMCVYMQARPPPPQHLAPSSARNRIHRHLGARHRLGGVGGGPRHAPIRLALPELRGHPGG